MKRVSGRKQNNKIAPIKPKVPEEPPLDVMCLCPHCGQQFTPLEMHGTYLNRLCPVCNSEVKPEDYDNLIQELRAKIELCKQRLIDAEFENERSSKLLKVCGFIFLRPFKFLAVNRANRTKSALSDAKSALVHIDFQLTSAARDRYYTSEYFQATHNPLKRTVVNPFELKPFYDKEGQWHMPRGKKGASGLTAEMDVFNLLLEEVRNPNSPLRGSRIVPNIYLPHQQRSGGSERFWDQIDLVLLTTRAAFVLEVKSRRNLNIASYAPFETIYSSKNEMCPVLGFDGQITDTTGWQIKETKALGQNSQHAVAFDKVCSLYSFDQIYEQVVFDDVRSFTSDSCDFVDNVSVSASEIERSETFIKPIINAFESLEDVIDEKGVNQEAERLIGLYGDLNQKRGIMHAWRIKKLENERKAHSRY